MLGSATAAALWKQSRFTHTGSLQPGPEKDARRLCLCNDLLPNRKTHPAVHNQLTAHEREDNCFLFLPCDAQCVDCRTIDGPESAALNDGRCGAQLARLLPSGYLKPQAKTKQSHVSGERAVCWLAERLRRAVPQCSRCLCLVGDGEATSRVCAPSQLSSKGSDAEASKAL